MKLRAVFQRKESDYDAVENCEVSRVVELPNGQFDYFIGHLLDDQDFLIELRSEMGYTEDGVRHCLLVLPEGGDDGVLVDAQGSSYARYSAFIPNARQQVILGQYQSLADFTKEMYGHAEEATQRILKNQVDGSYYLQLSDLPDPQTNPLFDHRLLGEMLSERPEFETVETMSSEILVSVAPEYQRKLIDESQYRELTSEDVDIMLAKHMLYMRDAGGEHANFSGCLIKNKGLSHAVFNGAIISNAAFVDCDFTEADLNFVTAHGTKFINCDMENIYGDEADFSYAQFTNCDMRHALTTHANYTGADFNQCNVERMLLQGCCLARVNWNGTDETVASRQGAVYTVEEYNGEQLPNEIKIE